MTTPLVSPWTLESEERLRAMVLEGKLNCREIAMELGVTRGACIGKMYRMGLHGPPQMQGRPREPKPITLPSAPPKIAKFAKPPPARRPKTKPVRMEPAPPTRRGRVRFMDLTDRTCRWPLFAGDEAFHMKHYCGRVPVTGSPYCKAHLQVAYAKP